MPLLETRGSSSALSYGFNSFPPPPPIVTSGLQVYFDTTVAASYGGQNLLKVSNNPTNTSYWSLGNASVVTSSATTGPTETIFPIYSGSVYKLTENATSEQHLLFQSLGSTTTIGNVETLSGYFKAAERTQIAITMHGEGYPVFDLSTGSVTVAGGSNTSAFMRNAGNGWWYCSATFARTNTTRNYYFVLWNNGNNYQGTTGNGVYFYNGQLRYNSQSIEGFVNNPSTSELTINSSTWYDISGNGINATATGTTVTSDFGPRGWRFNEDETKYMQTSTGINFGNNWSYEFTMYNNNDGNSIPFMTGYHLNDQRESINLDLGGGDGKGFIYGGSDFPAWPQVQMPKAYSQYKFIKISVTNTNGLFNVWLSTREDGPLKKIVTNYQGNTGQTQTGARLYMGRYSNFNGYAMNGSIYGLKIYNRALTESEVKQNFDAERKTYGL
jgi:hypothetical protein